MHEIRISGFSLKCSKRVRIRPKEGIWMNKLIARLMACGMTAKVALSALRRFRCLHDAELYVEEIEEESREQVDVL